MVQGMEMKLALSQYPITEHTSFEAWETYMENWISFAVSSGAKILVFPEYASMELTSLYPSALRNDLKGQLWEMQEFLPRFIAFFQKLTQVFDCVIVAPSFPVRMGEKFVNRAYVFSAEEYSFQDKHFMTRFEDEDWGISSSDGVLRVFETKYGTFGIQICFDIEFAVGGQLLAQNGAEFIVVPSCTETLKGATRVHIGARARAMEQQIYVGVSQTVGNALWSPAVDMNYGYSAVYSSPDGDFDDEGILAIEPAQKEGWLLIEVDTARNREIRESGQVLNYKWSSVIEMNAGLTVEPVKL